MGGSSGGGGGDSSPKGVTIKGGKMKASQRTSSLDRTTNMQREAKATTAGKKFGVMTIEQRRDKAISQLEKRLENPQLPRIGIGGIATGAISDANLRRQIEALRGGADPNFSRSSTGEYVAVGVTTSKGVMGSAGDISGMTASGAKTIIGSDDPSNAVTPEVTSEIVPDDAGNVGLTGGRSTRGSKRTRGKRFGGAGADYGTGILSGN